MACQPEKWDARSVGWVSTRGKIEYKFVNCLVCFSTPSRHSTLSMDPALYFPLSRSKRYWYYIFPFCCSYRGEKKKKRKEKKRDSGISSAPYEGLRRSRRSGGLCDGSGGSGGGLQSPHQQAAMTSCHSCQGLWEIFCQGKANSSSFGPNRTVRPSEQGGNVASLELRALFKTAALRRAHGSCNKGPSVRRTGQHRELVTGFTVMHRLGLKRRYWSWK